MKSETEIQRAHDILSAVNISALSEALPEGDVKALKSALHALCWVLDHEHEMLSPLLASISAEASKAGFSFGKPPMQ